MRAIQVEGKGRDAKLVLGEAPEPALGPDDVEIAVRATAVNHADLLQRRGLYPPPPGASPVLGLECAGVVARCGERVAGFVSGERVMALLPGGGYAERAVVHAGSVMRVPASLTDEEAAALPEVCLTVFQNLFRIAGLEAGDWALVHGGGSGIGTAAIGMLREAGLHVIVSCGSDEKIARCLALGADVAFDYRAGDFADRVLEASGDGVAAVLDSIGAPYVEWHLRCLRPGGALVLIGLRGGSRAEVNLGTLMAKRLRIVGSTLRGLPAAEKAVIVEGFTGRFAEALAQGRLRPVIDRVLPLAAAQSAHEVLERSEHFGKVVLRVAEG